MEAKETPRGFVRVSHPPRLTGENDRLIQESSAVGDYEDSMAKPGSSYLWVGHHHHLNREQVREVVERLTYWLETGRLKVDP